jgi:hypothetical protein
VGVGKAVDTRRAATASSGAVPAHIIVSPDVDLDAEDPARVQETGRRRCIAVRQAGGRCTVTPCHSGVTCPVHAGLLQASEGGKAKARKSREAKITAEERTRLARIGSRGVIQEALAEKAEQLRATVHTLLDAAATGDLQAAKLVAPYLNQAYGMPTERLVHEVPQTPEEIRQLPTAELLRLVRESA